MTYVCECLYVDFSQWQKAGVEVRGMRLAWRPIGSSDILTECSCFCPQSLRANYGKVRRLGGEFYLLTLSNSGNISPSERYVICEKRRTQNYRIFSNLIRTSFCRFLKRKKISSRFQSATFLQPSLAYKADWFSYEWWRRVWWIINYKYYIIL